MTTTRHIEFTHGTKTQTITLRTPRTLAEIHELFKRAVSAKCGNAACVACWQATTDPIAHVHVDALPEHSGTLRVV